MPAVLVFNEEKATDTWAWDDHEGARHHFPNTYKGIVVRGEKFVYYRGVRRPGRAKGDIEFFGQGVVGEVWPDPRTDAAPPRERSWFCSIEDYTPFPKPVSARADDGEGYLEGIAKNRLQNIRRLPEAIYDDILVRAFGQAATAADAPPIPTSLPDAVARESPTSLLLPRVVSSPAGGLPGPGYARRSGRAKLIGDLAEAHALRFIREIVDGATDVRHVAAAGETPGWDIEYLDTEGRLQRVEVKGTTAAAFMNFELTVGELEAARRWGRDYWMYFVARCESSHPMLTRLRDPASLLDRQLLAMPILFRVWSTADQVANVE